MLVRKFIATVCILVAGLAGVAALTNRHDSLKEDVRPVSKRLEIPSSNGLDPNGGLFFQNLEFRHQAKPNDEKVVATFPFRNTGTRNVTITQVKTSCGWLSRRLEKEVYASDEQGHLDAEFQFGSRTGKQNKMVTVYTDDVTKSSHSLRLIVDIPEPVKIWPKLVHWQAGEGRQAKIIRVQFSHDSPVSIRSVEPEGELVTAAVRTIKDGSEYEIELTPTEKGPPGQIPVRITTDLPFSRLRNQVVYARILGPGQDALAASVPHLSNSFFSHASPRTPLTYEMTPNTVQWKLGEAVEAKSIRIRATTQAGLLISSVAASDAFRAELRTLHAGRKYELLITPKSTESPTVDMLQLTTEEQADSNQPNVIPEPLVAFAVVTDEE